MEAMPQMYRDDITRTQQAIARAEVERDALPPGHPSGGQVMWLVYRLSIQLEELERALVRAEQDWAAAVAQGAGVRLDP